MKTSIDQTLKSIESLESAAFTAARERLDSLTKPPGSLGRLEDLAAQVYAVQKKRPLAVDPALVVVAAGDHGVAKRGVSPFPQEVTRQMVANFLAGGAGVSVMAETAGVGLVVLDAGCAGGEFPEHDALVQAKVAQGTQDISQGPAMSVEQCEQALRIGIDLANRAHQEGVKAVGMGEMGIGNTTPATALYAALFGLDPEAITGPGAGLNQRGVSRKALVVREALQANASAVKSQNGREILTALGGYEIAALAGLALGAAANRMLVFVDGFIATSAFAAAWSMKPEVMEYAVFAHASAEPGHIKALQAMNAEPLLNLGLRLGEGTGGVLAMQIARQACAVYNDMATFAEAGVSDK